MKNDKFSGNIGEQYQLLRLVWSIEQEQMNENKNSDFSRKASRPLRSAQDLLIFSLNSFPWLLCRVWKPHPQLFMSPETRVPVLCMH